MKTTTAGLSSATLLTSFLIAVACGTTDSDQETDDDSSDSGDGDSTGTSGSGNGDGDDGVCEPGETRVCVGPGACDGAQSCSAQGTLWNTCDCGGGTATGGADGSGGADAAGGADGTGGADAAGGADGAGGDGSVNEGGGCLLDSPSPAPGPTTTQQYAESEIVRGGVNYKFLANGWGPGWKNHTINYTTQGTAFEVVSFNGTVGSNYEPAGYPSVYCGDYSNPVKSSGECGLPAALSSIKSLQTGLRWSHTAGNGTYSVAYDVWLSNGGDHSGYFMVWFRDPPGQQPAGGVKAQAVTVAGVPGVWDIWTGTVGSKPITNYVRREGTDTHELAFDLKDFFSDSAERGYPLPGSEVMSVAVGVEIWAGPVTTLKVEDFCVDVR